MTMSLKDHLEEYMEQGYTIFRDYLPKETIAALRAQAEPYFEELIAKKQPGKGGFWQAAKVGGRGRVALAPAIGPELAERGMLPALEGLLGTDTLLRFAEMESMLRFTLHEGGFGVCAGTVLQCLFPVMGSSLSEVLCLPAL